MTGTIIDARDRRALFRNFEQDERILWENDQTYSSLLSVPVFDDKNWYPIGVACISSIKKIPFWQGLTGDEKLNLERSMRATFRNVIDYTSVF